MNIISPEFSFLDFNYIDNDVCDNESIVSLPVCTDLSIKAQFYIESETEIPTTEALYIAIADEDCNVILDNDIEVTPICSKYKFLTTYEDNPVPETDIYNLCNTDNDEPISVQDFTTNPFDLITSTDLEYEVEFSPIGKQFQLYCQGKLYIFYWTVDDFGANGYSYSVIDNIYYVAIELDISAGGRIHMRKFLEDVFDVNHGTTTTFNISTNVMTMANMPTGSYLNNYLFYSVSYF